MAFESSDAEGNALLKPLRVPTRHQDIYVAAKEMVDDLPGWSLVSEDSDSGLLTCRRDARFLSGQSTVSIRVEGPDDIPSTTVTLRSETSGGMREADKKNVLEFMKLFYRRVCP